MEYILVGLGNPGDGYKKTRHNTGRRMLEYFAKYNHFPDWERNKKINALVSENFLGKDRILLVLPDGFMNKSGLSLKTYISNRKKAERLVVVYDDIDLPLGKIRLSFGRGSGGHRGLESIIKTIGTRDFVRVRVGISPSRTSGKVIKPIGEKKVLDFLMRDITKREEEVLKKTRRRVSEALLTFIEKGKAEAMNQFN